MIGLFNFEEHRIYKPKDYFSNENQLFLQQCNGTYWPVERNARYK